MQNIHSRATILFLTYQPPNPTSGTPFTQNMRESVCPPLYAPFPPS